MLMTAENRSRRKALALTLTAAAVLALASSGPARAQQAMRVGFSDSPPISYRNAATGALQGVAVAVSREVARETGIKTTEDLLSFGDLFPALKDGKVDVVTMSGTPERRLVAAFSQPFAKYGETLLVRVEDSGEYKDLAALRGKRVASNAGGGWIPAAQAAGAIIVTFPGAEGSLKALETGEVAAVVGNAPTYNFLMKSGAYSHVRVAAGYVPKQTNEIAFAVRLAEASRLDAINAALGRLASAGVLERLRAEWGF